MLGGVVLVLLLLAAVWAGKFEEEQYGVKYASDCEVCKVSIEQALVQQM